MAGGPSTALVRRARGGLRGGCRLPREARPGALPTRLRVRAGVSGGRGADSERTAGFFFFWFVSAINLFTYGYNLIKIAINSKKKFFLSGSLSSQ